jgi:hypothetical protein
MANTFLVSSPYSPNNGISIEINSVKIQLSLADICYLLLDIDGAATVSKTPPAIVAFTLHGVTYEFTNEEWADFVDALSSVAGEGGWSHTDCPKPKE